MIITICIVLIIMLNLALVYSCIKMAAYVDEMEDRYLEERERNRNEVETSEDLLS